MKQIISFGFCLAAFAPSFAQTTTTTTTTTTVRKTTQTIHTPAATGHGSAIGGSIRDARYHPLAGVEAFIYLPDSSIIASGYTDALGAYETNGVGAGVYDLKIVYPSNKVVIVKGVPVKASVTQVNLNMNAPEADTILLYADVAPKAEPKKKAK